MAIYICDQCGKEFISYPSLRNRSSRGTFCSRQCWSDFTNAEWKCEYCGASHIALSRGQTKRFCDLECRKAFNRSEKIRTCSSCGQIKPIDDFPLSQKNDTLHRNRCRECQAENAREWYKKHRSSVRRDRQKDYQANPAKWRAYGQVQYAIKCGVLLPASDLMCVCCNSPAQQYHHDCYCEEHAIVVRPMCVSCHKLFHARNEVTLDPIEGKCTYELNRNFT